jgi:hypothetical protein
MERTVVVIQVSGGLIIHVSSNNDDVGYVVIDRDNIEQGDPYPSKENIQDMDYIFDNLEKYLIENKPVTKIVIQDNPESLKDYFESHGFNVHTYLNDQNDTCAELTIKTNGGIEKNIQLEPFDKDGFIDYVNDFNVDNEIDFYRRNDNKYLKDFTVKESLKDFEDFQQFLIYRLYEL